MKDIEIVVFQDKSWVRLTEYQKLKQQVEKMTIKQITKTEYVEISDKETTYFVNGCIFDEETDNLLAFEKLQDETFTYWQVVE